MERFEQWMTTVVDLETGQGSVRQAAATTRVSATGSSPGQWNGGRPCGLVHNRQCVVGKQLDFPGDSGRCVGVFQG